MEISEKLYVGDVVEMRKQHPCGGSQWQVTHASALTLGWLYYLWAARDADTARFYAPGQEVCQSWLQEAEESAG